MIEEITLPQIVTVIGGLVAIWGVYAKLVKLIKEEIKDSQAGQLQSVGELIKTKLKDYDQIELDKRVLRQEKYESEFNNLNKRAESCVDKLISLESEIKDEGGINERIFKTEFEISAIKGRLDV